MTRLITVGSSTRGCRRRAGVSSWSPDRLPAPRDRAGATVRRVGAPGARGRRAPVLARRAPRRERCLDRPSPNRVGDLARRYFEAYLPHARRRRFYLRRRTRASTSSQSLHRSTSLSVRSARFPSVSPRARTKSPCTRSCAERAMSAASRVGSASLNPDGSKGPSGRTGSAGVRASARPRCTRGAPRRRGARPPPGHR